MTVTSGQQTGPIHFGQQLRKDLFWFWFWPAPRPSPARDALPGSATRLEQVIGEIPGR